MWSSQDEHMMTWCVTAPDSLGNPKYLNKCLRGEAFRNIVIFTLVVLLFWSVLQDSDSWYFYSSFTQVEEITTPLWSILDLNSTMRSEELPTELCIITLRQKTFGTTTSEHHKNSGGTLDREPNGHETLFTYGRQFQEVNHLCSSTSLSLIAEEPDR